MAKLPTDLSGREVRTAPQPASASLDHVWFWRVRLPERKDEPCRVVARGRKNSVLIEFADGLRVITSRYAVRKRRDEPGQS